ncbi:MAG: Na+/H+ antiporter NhaC family protein [Acutalibacteraceae bacterium]
MKKKTAVKLISIVAAIAIVVILAIFVKGSGLKDCGECEGSGVIVKSVGDVCENDGKYELVDCEDCTDGKVDGAECETCGGEGKLASFTCAECEGEGKVPSGSNYYATFMALVPPIIAIALALITKEVYSSLFVGIVAGALLYTNFNPVNTVTSVVNDGLIGSLADSWNVGILIFLVLLGTIVALVNKAGGSIAFGRWAQTHIKTRVGAQLATFALGVLIFIDDYFNCLTVGSVMKPLSDSHKISRAKLAYLIDATAAPICMIAPISSWAAAVSGVVEGKDGLQLFIAAIPYNFYSLLTIVMIIAITFMKFDYGPMKRHELNAIKGDLFSEGERNEEDIKNDFNKNGKVIDLIFPVVILIAFCVIGMIYSGGFFDSSSENFMNFISAFAGSDASVGLSYGGIITLIVVIAYLLLRRTISFTESMECLKKGFCAMVPAILILTLAWTLNGMTSHLGAAEYVSGLMSQSAQSLANFLPAIIFLVAVGLSFSTGTSWGTFGILIPIVVAVFRNQGDILTIAISACLSGAVCGDHCSPISDTTIMASAGAQCNHLNHVSTQLPYALTVAGVSVVAYIIAGFVHEWYITLPIAIVMMIGTLFVIKAATSRKNAQTA